MKTLKRPDDLENIRARLARLKPNTPRQWGRMTAPQMVCHVTDAFRNLLGERPTRATRPASRLRGTLIKWLALYAPTPWPHGVRTRAEVDQERGGTPPAEFARDIQELLAACDRFLASTATIAQQPHFMFGPLTEAEWARWAYLHMDHHLRQFGL